MRDIFPFYLPIGTERYLDRKKETDHNVRDHLYDTDKEGRGHMSDPAPELRSKP